MFRLGTLQVGIRNANLTKTPIQPPLFNAGAEFLQLWANSVVGGNVHG